MKTFSERLKRLRIEKGISQKTLSTALGINVKQISNWENSKHKPRIKYVIAISKYFNLKVDYFLGLID